jgi:plastocyanin
MTTHDENHITRTTGKRFAKGLIIVLVPIVVLGFFTVTLWHETAKYPPPVSAPPPRPAAEAGAAQQSSAGAGAGAGGGDAPATGAILTIPAGASTQGNPSYEPAAMTSKKGDTITVTNDDTVPHTATSGTGPEDPNSGKSFDTSIINAAESGKIDTSQLAAGEYPFYCAVHPYMKGKLTVQ